MTNAKQPTTEQMVALQSYAKENGRTWKSKLNHDWMTGIYSRSVDGALLQQVRNTFGPSWLVHFRLPKSKGLELPEEFK
jgi:hypothetical protein